MSLSMSSESVEGTSIRNSLDESNSSAIVGKKLPHYLQPSPGSCHDFCKYGKHHEFEKNPRKPIPRRQNKKRVNDEYPVEILMSGKKTPEVKLTPQHNVKSNAFENPEVIKCTVSANSADSQALDKIESKTKSGAILSTDPKRLSSAKRVSQRKKMPLVTRSADSLISVTSRNVSGKELFSMAPKVIPVQPRNSLDSSQRVKKWDKRTSSGMLEASFKQSSLRTEGENSFAKRAISSRPNLSSPDSLHLTSGRKISEIKTEQRAGTHSATLKKGLASPKCSFSHRSSGIRIQKVSSSKILRNVFARDVTFPDASSSSKVPFSREARGLSAHYALLPSKISVSRATSIKQKKQGRSEVKHDVKNQKKSKKVDNGHHEVKQGGHGKSIRNLEGPKIVEVMEKTLYVIKMETENKYVDSDVNEKVSVDSSQPLSSLSPSVPSQPKSPSPSPFNHSEQDDEESEYCSTNADEETFDDDDGDDDDNIVDDDDESNYVEDVHALEGEKHRSRNSEVISQVDKDGRSVKLRFRRGKVVDISSETRSPRRLKFRRGRVLGETHNVKSITKVQLKEGGSEGNPDDHQVDSEKVVLRHQDVQGKKDTQGLFNNVIKETASKLAETRKSKVKALVGAFETVISLQDSKPSANAVF